MSLPDVRTRIQLLESVLSRGAASSTLSETELERLSTLTDGYSGSDLTALCRDAALGPIRGGIFVILPYLVSHYTIRYILELRI